MTKFTRFDAVTSVAHHPYASKKLGKDHWVVTKGFTYELDHLGSNKKVHVPAGYLTDGASVPRMFWSLIPPWGEYGQAAILHDWLCENLCYYDYTSGNKVKVSLTRKEVDKVFGEALEVLGVSTMKRKIMEAGVNGYRMFVKISNKQKHAFKKTVEQEVANHYKEHNEYVF